MGELQVALALAVSMLVFSTFVSAIVEVLHRAFTLRKHGMKVLIEKFYEQEVMDRLQNLIPAHARGQEEPGREYRGKFLFQMWSGLKSKPPEDGSYATVSRNTLASKFPLPMLDGSVDRMDVAEFFRRLAETDIGRKIGQKAPVDIDILIDDLATRFEDYGRQVSAYFKRRSQIISVIIAVLFALGMNANVVSLVRAFQNDETLTTDIINHANTATANYQAQLAATRAASNGQSVSESQLKAIEDKLADLRKGIADAQDLGLPFGWTDNELFNGSDINNFLSPNQTVSRDSIDFLSKAFWAWLFTTIATGLLIGLGGPFWYDMIQRLSAVTQVASALTSKASQDGGTNVPAEALSKETVAKSAARDAFKTVTRANNLLAHTEKPPSQNWRGPKALRL
ncbi:hypothetical protein [Kordiimonas aestuarii]|uniref:hypothetical protein n=1 Tax=Kordiimonas aestuarii TaxID=1005925 RepID=UPI0021D28F0A|nr:hypothetical protein [Kordiimonas aestuarii]